MNFNEFGDYLVKFNAEVAIFEMDEKFDDKFIRFDEKEIFIRLCKINLIKQVGDNDVWEMMIGTDSLYVSTKTKDEIVGKIYGYPTKVDSVR